MTTDIFAKHALLPAGWTKDVTISINQTGQISSVIQGDERPHDARVGILLPAASNVHSHSFQRAMAGLAENRGGRGMNDFWTWRQVMYRFLEALTPDDIETISAQVQMEMLEAGYAAQAEFHYLHHAPGGDRYDVLDELSLRHFEAARLTGIGYTHLPVLYMQAGVNGSPLRDGQLRFGCSVDEFGELFGLLAGRMKDIPSDFTLGIAPHSLRAVSRDGLRACLDLDPGGPFHIHAAEQAREVKEVIEGLGARPLRWLLDNMPVDNRWCFIHATHLDEGEIADFAATGAVAGLCPLTEANLGDGVFAGPDFTARGGAFGIGSDSNVIISLTEELRQLETSQRLRDKRRLVLTDEKTPSNGRFLYEKAVSGGAKAIGRNAGRIETGALADLVALNDQHPTIAGLEKDLILDAWIFANGAGAVSDVWAAGRHVVRDGAHIERDRIAPKFADAVRRLRAVI